jgi:hypothetical protein
MCWRRGRGNGSAGREKRIGGSAYRRGKKRVGVEAYETRDPTFFIADTPYADPPIRFSPAGPFHLLPRVARKYAAMPSTVP